jgi:hypothetical protein
MLSKNLNNFPGLSFPQNNLAHLVIREITQNVDFDIRIFVVAVVPKNHLLVFVDMFAHNHSPFRVPQLGCRAYERRYFAGRTHDRVPSAPRRGQTINRRIRNSAGPSPGEQIKQI